MKTYKSPQKNFFYFCYRILKPVLDPIAIVYGLYGYVWFFRDLIKYKLADPKTKILNLNFFPVLTEKVSFTPFDAHYFHQQLWVFENVQKTMPNLHVDISSTYHMSGYLSKIVKTIFIDYRPIDANLKNLKIQRGDILNLKLKDSSVSSLSCLHTIEHIGLGRYGDPIDPLGTKKACEELSRVLSKKGRMYLSTPVGRDRICFNAHRVHTPDQIIKYCKGLRLLSFSVVDDEGKYHSKAEYKKYSRASYACGMFIFTKK